MSPVIHKELIVSLAARDPQLTAAFIMQRQISMCCRNHPRKQSCQAGERKTDPHGGGWGGGLLPVSAGASHPGALLLRDLSTERWRSAHREACVGCVFHNRHIPSSFLLTCRCLLPSAPLPVSTCSHSPLAPPSGSAPTPPEGLKQPTPAPPVQLTSVVLLRLPGHWLAAGIVSHARAPVPSALPGPPSPEAPGSRAKPKAASVFFPQTWSACGSRASRSCLASPLPSSRCDWVSPSASL